MNKKTKKALEGSIKKWKEIVKGTGIDEQDDNCPLCKLSGCSICPVGIKTGRNCLESPYGIWHDHQCLEHYTKVDRKVHCPTCKTIAKEELRFLKSLRVKEISHVRPI